MTAASALDHCNFYMQKKKGLCAEFCSSGAAELASRKLWIMIELSQDLYIISRNSGISLGLPTFKGKQGCLTVCTLGLGFSCQPATPLCFPSSENLFSPTHYS